MTLNRIAKNKSEDAMNTWSYAVIGDKLKKIDKKLIKKKFRTEIKKRNAPRNKIIKLEVTQCTNRI